MMECYCLSNHILACFLLKVISKETKFAGIIVSYEKAIHAKLKIKTCGFFLPPSRNANFFIFFNFLAELDIMLRHGCLF